MTESEREMLLGKAPSGGGGGERKGGGRKKKRSLGRRLAVGLAGLAGALLLLGVGLWLGGPGIAAWLTPREVAMVVGGRDGKLTIDRVEYSWAGPQRARGIRLVDADGKTMADVEVEATTGLIEAWRSGDLGTLRLSGKVDVREAQLQSGGVSLALVGSGGGAGSGSGGGGGGRREPMRLPTDFRFSFETKGLDLTYTPGQGQVIRVEGLDIAMEYERGQRVSFKASSRAPAASVEVEGRNLVGADGAVAPLSAEVDCTVQASLPGAMVDSLARAGLGWIAGSVGRNEDGELTISAAMQVRGGRMRLADSGKPMRIETRALPGAVIDLIAGPGSAVAVTRAPGVVVEVSGLDAPIGAIFEGGEMDLRGAAFVARVTTTRAQGLVALAIGESAREVEIEPAEVEVRIEDFSGEAVARGGASALIDGAAAGKFSLSATVSGMLDEKGRLKVTPGAANAELGLAGAPTALLEPLAAGSGVSLRETLGRSVDASVTARTVKGVGGGDQIEITGAMSSEFAHGSVALRSDGSRYWKEGVAVEFEFVRPGGAARAALLGRGFEVTGDGVVTGEVRDLDLMLGAGVPDLNHSKAVVDLTLGGLSLRRIGDDREVAIKSVRTALALDGGPRLRATIDGQIESGGRAMEARAEMEITGAVMRREGGEPGFDVGFDMKDLTGTIRLTGVPSDGLGAIDGSAAWLAREGLGESVNVEVVVPAPGEVATSGELNAGIVVESANARLTTAARLAGRTLSVGPASGRIRVTPGLVAALRELAPEEQAWWPRLEGAVEVEFSARRSSVELDESWAPRKRTIRPVQAMASVTNDIVVSGLPIGADWEASDQKVGLRGVAIGGEYDFENPLASEGSVRLSLFEPEAGRGGGQGEGGVTVAEIEALTSLVMPPPALTVRVTKVDTKRLDRILGRPGLTSEALGREAGFALVGATPGAGRPVEYEVTVVSERLSAKGLMTKGADRYTLSAPMVVEWEAPAPWLNAHALAPAKKEAPAAVLAFTEPVKMRAELRSLSIGATNPMAAGVFALDARLSAPAARFVTDRDERLELDDLAVTARSGNEPGSVEFSLSADRQRAWRASENAWAAVETPMKVEGRVDDLADSSGAMTSERARVTASVTGSAPTALLDAVSGMNGLLVDALGPTTSVEIKAEGLSREGGRIDATAKTDFADAKISGRMEKGIFVAEGAPIFTLRRITPELSDRVFESVLPMLAQFEKTEEDEPASITASGLRVPMDGNIAGLNGSVTLSLGTLQFETSSIFGELLKATGNRAAGRIGRKVKPFEATIENGVVKYERVELPIGDSTIVARGRVDMVNQTMDIVTFVPVLAVADKALRISSVAPGLTMIPIRTKGPFGKARSEVALELILEEGLPGSILGGVGDAAGGAAEGVGGIITGLGDLLNDAMKKQEEGKRKKEEKKRRKKEEAGGGGS